MRDGKINKHRLEFTALGHLDPVRPLPFQALILVFFCFVWGFLGALLSRIFREVVTRLSAAPPARLIALTSTVATKFGLTPREVKQYIRFIADRRLIELGLSELFHVAKNPLPWLDEMLNAVEHANFFENRATEYSKASTAGSWEEAFAG